MKHANKPYWMYGLHAVAAALENPARETRRLLMTSSAQEEFVTGPLPLKPETVTTKEIDQAVGRDAVHQGIALLVEPLEEIVLEDVLEVEKPLLLLDQVTDPQNVGAILRSAAAFDVAGVIAPRDGAAHEGGALAKAACGALDMIPYIHVTNLSRAMEQCQKAGFWVAGLDGEAKQTVKEAKLGKKTALVLGAEGKGLRRLTAENCDLLVKIPMHPQMESLNVSNAAAISLYELFTN